MPRLRDWRSPPEPPAAGAALAAGASAIDEAVQRLAAGSLVAMPTETVYGLAADADQHAAVARIYAMKGRPADHPLIVHLAADPAQREAAIAHYAREVPPFARALMQRHWPGPLTLILKRREGVAAAAAGGQDSIGLRCPDHPAAQALLAACAARGIHGLAAPSANRFGRVSPTRAAHVVDEFAEVADEDLLVLDGGDCAVGIESTIVDASRGRPVLLRPGQLSVPVLESTMGQPMDAAGMGATDAPRASGTLASHYAPRAAVRLMTGEQIRDALQLLGAQAPALGVYSRLRLRSAARQVHCRAMPADAAACAHELFAVLREFDARGVALIWVETPPEGREWDGVRDRLQRAAHH